MVIACCAVGTVWNTCNLVGAGLIQPFPLEAWLIMTAENQSSECKLNS